MKYGANADARYNAITLPQTGIPYQQSLADTGFPWYTIRPGEEAYSLHVVRV